ncbi:MAG: shikimate kinase [Lachnospiraceae bacterium]|nr:shikimate kinase [Lachnospiraceae bacterium]
MKENIVLIGYMGSGKSTVGFRLARKMKYRFVDTDQTIEKEQKTSISSIFAEKGEEYFRNLETQTIEQMAKKVNHSIVSTGGGLPMREVNGKILKELGFVVFLRVKKETILKRLSGDTSRPLLQGDNVEEKVQSMLEFRNPIYEYTAHLIVDVDDKSFDEIMDEIIRNYELMTKKDDGKKQ